MAKCRLETTVGRNGTIVLKKLPFQSGEKVEILIKKSKQRKKSSTVYPLRKKPFRYQDPFSSVAENEWNIV